MDTFKHISVEELFRQDLSDATLLDVREPDQALLGTIDGAVNIPFSALEKQPELAPKTGDVYVFCQEGNRSLEAAALLSAEGLAVTNVDGGWTAI